MQPVEGMNFDEAHANVTGLEDDDNFFELVRGRAKLQTREDAVELTQEVMLYVCHGLGHDLSREFLSFMPRDVDEYVFPRLDFYSDPGLSLSELERQICGTHDVDTVTAARMIAAVGLSTVDRIPHEQTKLLLKRLPRDLQTVFRDKYAEAA